MGGIRPGRGVVTEGAWSLALGARFLDNPRTMGQRVKRKLKSRPKYKRVRSLKDRRMKAKKAGWHKRGLARNKARRQQRGKAGTRKTGKPGKKRG